MKVVFASHNENKIIEVRKMLPDHIQILSLNDLGCTEEIPETGTTLEENAKIKANHVTKEYGYACFADDTGLIVDALDGAPGVYSARYAGEQKSAEANMDKLLDQLKGKASRLAHFKTAIVLNINEEQYLFEGKVEGEITTTKRGTDGFGYDPIFRPLQYKKTFAELSMEVKNKISHRGLAMQKLISHLTQTEYAGR